MPKNYKKPFHEGPSLKNILLNVLDYVKRIFLNGLFTLLPLTLTIALFGFSFRLIKSWLQPIARISPQFLRDIPHSEIILVIITIFIVGFISHFFLTHQLWHLFEATIEKIPLLRSVYFGIKQLIHAFTAKDEGSFQKIVLLEFPRPGIYSLGFLTSAIPQEIAPDTLRTYYSVFIPATPNPTTGYYVIVPEDACRVVDLSKQEAMTLIISGGIIQPDRFKINK